MNDKLYHILVAMVTTDVLAAVVVVCSAVFSADVVDSAVVAFARPVKIVFAFVVSVVSVAVGLAASVVAAPPVVVSPGQ